jgi:D-sedoheptulose 7-phosphate isomerase
MSFSSDFLKKCCAVLEALDPREVDEAVRVLSELKEREGRLFIAGSGGGAGHAAHATADFRKLCNIEAYAPYDNVPELTARVNDDGWETTLVNWLKVSRLSAYDCLLLFSVGGGDSEKRISTNLVNAAEYARQMGTAVIGIVGRDGGAIAQTATVSVIIPAVDEDLLTPLTEGIQSVVWHLLAFHPALQTNMAKWESELKA